eukprot:scaffold2490_cov109-Cylindrotheca_fusiformis.AAC.1
MAGNDPPPNIDMEILDDDPIDLDDFDAAVKGMGSGTKSRDGFFRKLHDYKTSLYFSIDDPESAAGKKFIRNKFAMWLSKVKASRALDGKPLVVTSLDGNVLDVTSLPTDGQAFADLVGWKKTKEGSNRNVFLCVNLTMHINFASLKHSVIDYLKEALIMMKRNNSLGDQATETAVIGWISGMLPDLHLLCLQSMFNRKVTRLAKKCDPKELSKYGIDPEAEGEIFLTHGSVSGLSKVFGSVTNNRVVVVECPRRQVAFYMKYLQTVIDMTAWSPDLQQFKFVPFAMKNKDAHPEVFAKMIVRNSKENAQKTYFQILGVSPKWFTVKVQKLLLIDCPKITHVDLTDLAGKQGRWRIYCKKEHEDEVAKWLEEDLEEFCLEHCTDDWVIPGFEVPRLVAKSSKLPPSQMADLVEACNEIFTEDLVNFPELVPKGGSTTPPARTPPGGAWTSRPAVSVVTPVLPVPRQVPMSTTSPTLDSSVTRSVADLRSQLAEQKAWRDKLEAERAEHDKKQKSMMDDIAQLQKVVAEQSSKLEEQYDFLKDMMNGQATIDKTLARNEQETRERFETTSSEIKTMMTILMGLDSKIGTILPYVNPKSKEGPTTPPRVVRGVGAMETESDDEDLSEDTYTQALSVIGRRVNNPTNISPSGDQKKRPPKESPAKRTRRSATRKSARTSQQTDVSYPGGDHSYSSHGSGTPTVSAPSLAPPADASPVDPNNDNESL